MSTTEQAVQPSEDISIQADERTRISSSRELAGTSEISVEPIGTYTPSSTPILMTSTTTLISPTARPPLVTELSASPVRVPGTYPPEWLPDHETDRCMACENLFTLIKRRHHCRSCGKIFCSDCCKQKAKLLYLDNREARVCNNCYDLVEFTLTQCNENVSQTSSDGLNQSTSQQATDFDHQSTSTPSAFTSSPATTSTQLANQSRPSTSSGFKVQSVLKNSNPALRLTSNLSDLCNNEGEPDQPSQKQVTFSDGIRPGTDLSEPSPNLVTSMSSLYDSTIEASFSTLSRQSRSQCDSHDSTEEVPSDTPTKSRSDRSHVRNITVCDDLGYLPPIVISRDSPIVKSERCDELGSTNSLTNLIMNQFKTSRKTIQASMESRNCPLNGIVRFKDISNLVGVDSVVTFLLLKSFYLKVKIVKKDCCIDNGATQQLSNKSDLKGSKDQRETEASADCSLPEYWCFTSAGLEKLGQEEIMFVLNKEKNDSCIPRDIFKIYLTLHELALRRQVIENLGNLLFQDGLFGSRDTAGLLFVRPTSDHCLKNLVVPNKRFLVALVLQRWEVPWSKVFPIRLLLRLGHKYETYPYPLVSLRSREPAYYEIGHTIISILGDFRNFRYALNHVDGLNVMMNKTNRKIVVRLLQSNYLQLSKVLDGSNNEHVLALSSCPFTEADGHLVSVQNDDGQYETCEFYKKSPRQDFSFRNIESGPLLGASFIVFSGALKVNQSGQPAKISVVEDGLLIQIQSCTMSALRNAIHYMDDFDIDCENIQDAYNRLEVRWQPKEV